MAWLTPDIFYAELFPPELGYTIYRRDSISQKGGGVIILVSSTLLSESRPDFQTNCENLWVQLNLAGSRSLLIGAYYKPHELDHKSFEEFNKSFTVQTHFTHFTFLLFQLTPFSTWYTGIPSEDL